MRIAGSLREWLGRGALLTVSMLGISVLYAAMCLLALAAYLLKEDSSWRPKRYSTT